MDYSGSAAQDANRILRSTLTVSDSKPDFQPSLRRVQYDLDEINTQIKQCVSANTPQLIQVVQDIQETRKSSCVLKSDLENVTGEYQRLQREFISPYERLKRAHAAAQRLHQTCELVRACNWYLQVSKELEEATRGSAAGVPGASASAASASAASASAASASAASAASSATNIYTAATLVDKLEKLLESNVHLQSLAVIREHGKTLGPTRQRLVAHALDQVKENTSSKITLRNAVMTLCMFEKEKLLATIDTLVKAQASSAVLSVTRSVGSTAAFASAWLQTKEKASHLSDLSDILADCFLLTRAELRVGGPLAATFWTLVATNIGQKLHTMSVANPAQVKSMKSQASHILECVDEVSPVKDVFKKYL